MSEKETPYENALLHKCRELEKECEALRIVVLHNDRRCQTLMKMMWLMVVVIGILMFLVYSCTYRMDVWGLW